MSRPKHRLIKENEKIEKKQSNNWKQTFVKALKGSKAFFLTSCRAHLFYYSSYYCHMSDNLPRISYLFTSLCLQIIPPEPSSFVFFYFLLPSSSSSYLSWFTHNIVIANFGVTWSLFIAGTYTSCCSNSARPLAAAWVLCFLQSLGCCLVAVLVVV